MDNQSSRTNPRSWASKMLAAAFTLAAFALIPAGAAADPSNLSIAFTGQTGAGSWSPTPSTVLANASTTDPSNPVQSTTCSLDQATPITAIGAQQTVAVSGNGAHIVACYPVAADGTQGATEYATEQIDDQIPSVTLTGPATSPTWNNDSVTVTALASEQQPLAGIKSVTCFDDTGQQTVTPGSIGAITVTGSQRYTVSCYATTNADVIGAASSEQVWMDNTAPQLTYSGAPDPSNWYQAGQPVQVNMQTPADGATLQSLSCDYSGQPVLPGGALTEQAPPALHNWSVALILPSTGPGTLNCAATDTAGNVSPVVSTSQQVDPTAPRAVFVNNPNNPTAITARLFASISGIYGANIEYQQKGSWVTLPTTISGTLARALIPPDNSITNGQHALRVVVTDNANNQYVDYDNQAGDAATLDYPVAAGLHLLYTIIPSGHDAYGHPRANTDSNATIRLTYGQAAVIEGELYTSARYLLANQPLTLTVRLADGQPYYVKLRTNALGQWLYRLPAGGDRTIQIAYAGSVGLQPRSHLLRILNDGAITFTARPMKAGGQTTLTAHVLGGAIPASGLHLIAQWRPHANSPWETFPRLLAGPNGFASATVTTPPVAHGTRIELRVSTPGVRGWGYAGAISPILLEKVA